MSSGAAVFVMGPAGSGKTTFCSSLLQHCESIGRAAHLFNMDPAAENFEYEPSKDIRDLISVDDVMEELQYGPNGGLIFCLEYLLEHIEWLQEDLGQYTDEFLIVDCPGQIEIYTHFDIMPRLIQQFMRADYRVCVVYLMESQWMEDRQKFFSGVLNATAAMLQLGVPHLNVISKVDLLLKRYADDATILEDLEEDTNPLHRYFFPDPSLLEESLATSFQNRPRFQALNRALVQLIDDFDMVSFLPVNVQSEESLADIMSHIDNATQYSEQLEPKEPKEPKGDEFDGEYDEEEYESAEYDEDENDNYGDEGDGYEHFDRDATELETVD